MKIKPLGDRIVVEIEDIKSKEITSKGGILIETGSSADTKRHKEGIIIEIGPGKMVETPHAGQATGAIMFTYAPMSLKIGDRVIFTFGEMFKIDHKEYYILKESDIVATITE